VRLFRANSGTGWQGRVLDHTARYMTLENPRAFHGFPAGTADLIGWQTIEVTPDMVGQRLAVFVAVETKSPTGRPTPDQRRFVGAVRSAGGRAVVARTLADVAAVLGAPAGPVAPDAPTPPRRRSTAR
jgi:hypothetical protein